jgi:hypothetical protein
MSAVRSVWGLVAVLLAVPAGSAAAQESKKVKVTVVVILASERSDEVDPRLKCIAEEVRKYDPSLRGFTLASMACKSLPVDEKGTFLLLEDRKAQVVVHHCPDKHNRVCLGLTAPLQGEIVYRIVCGKFLPIVTRYQTRPRIPPRVVAQALGALQAPRCLGPVVAASLLADGRTRERLILAVRVQPCNGK